MQYLRAFLSVKYFVQYDLLLLGLKIRQESLGILIASMLPLIDYPLDFNYFTFGMVFDVILQIILDHREHVGCRTMRDYLICVVFMIELNNCLFDPLFKR